MRGFLIAVAVLLSANAASARESTNIPFAPVLPARYAISETRSVESGDGRHVTQTNYVLDVFEASDGAAFDAVLTVTATDNRGLHIGTENLLLLDFPVRLSLRDDGSPAVVRNWEAVRAEWLRRAAQDERFDDFSSSAWLNTGPQFAAALFGAPLSAIEPCHNVDWPIDEPAVQTREAPLVGGSGIRVMRRTHELRAIDREAGLAQVHFERVEELHGKSASDPAITTSFMRADCAVDLNSGVVRSGETEMIVEDAPPTESRMTLRSIIAVTPQ